VKPATLETIEDQLPQVFDRRTKPASWPDGVVVLRGDMDDHSNDTLEDDAFDPEGNLTGLSSLPDSKSPVQERLKRVHDELSEMFGPGDFPGAPTSTDGRQVLPPTDCYAFYLPWHHFPEQTWEIYLLVEGIDALGHELVEFSNNTLSLAEAIHVARIFLFHHEAYHNAVETFSARLEVTHRVKCYISFEGSTEAGSG
jgi:hypothetical protein